MSEIRCLDIELETPFQPHGVAFIRLPTEVKDFLLLVHKQNGIAGFQWDPDEPWNFGVVAKNEKSKE